MKSHNFLNFFLISIFFAFNLNAQWFYSKKITINSTGSALSDFQLAIRLDNQNFDYSLANPDGSDLRFSTDSTDNFSPDIPYWIESWDTMNASIVWVNIPQIPSTVNTYIYMFFGNNNAIYIGDPLSVFDMYDDFNGSVLDSVKWNEFGFGTYSIQNSYIRFTQDMGDWDKGIISAVPLLSIDSYKIRARYRLLDSNSNFHVQHKISNVPGTWHLRGGMTSGFDGENQGNGHSNQ